MLTHKPNWAGVQETPKWATDLYETLTEGDLSADEKISLAKKAAAENGYKLKINKKRGRFTFEKIMH